MREMSASFLIISRPSKINQDTAHQASTDAIEMSPILPVDIFYIHQPKISLMHQSSGLEDLTGLLCRHVAMRHAVQFVVNEGNQLLEGVLISHTPGLQ